MPGLIFAGKDKDKKKQDREQWQEEQSDSANKYLTIIVCPYCNHRITTIWYKGDNRQIFHELCGRTFDRSNAPLVDWTLLS